MLRLLLPLCLATLCFSQRVVSLTAPSTETLYAIGAAKFLVGVTATSVFPAQVMADRQSGRIKVLGHFSDPDPQQLRELRPTLILTGTGFQSRLAQRLRDEGYQVLHSDPHSIEDVFADMEKIGLAVGRASQARSLVRRLRSELELLSRQTASLPKRRVYIEVNHEGPWTSGYGNPLENLLSAAGGLNVFADDRRSVFRTTHEEVIRRNPSVILSPVWLNAKIGGIDGIISLGEIFRRPGYEKTDAWRDSRIHYYDSALLKHTGPRQVLAARKLAQLLHPTLFPPPAPTIPWEFGRLLP